MEVNQMAIDTYGYSRKEFLQMKIKDIRLPEDVGKMREAVRTHNGEYTEYGIWRHVKKNGEIINLDVKTNDIDYLGKECVLVLLNDVTDKLKREEEIVQLNKQLVNRISEREKSFEELEKSNQRYEYVSKAANETIWDLDLETNVISFGGSYKEMFGYAYYDDKIPIDKVQHLIHPHDAERVQKAIADALSDNTRRYWEDHYRVIKKGGGIVYVHDRAYIIYNEGEKDFNGKPVRFVGVIQNITQEKLNEEAMLEQLRKVNIIIESMTDPFFVLGKNLEVLLINKAALKLAKLEYEEIIGKDFHNINLSEDRKPMLDMFKKAVHRQEVYHEELEIQGKWVEVSLYPSEIGLAVYAKSISERKNHEEDVIRNAKFIKEISDSTSGFIFQLEYDTEGIPKLNYASKKAFDYWGISIEDVINDKTKLLNAVHPEDSKYVKNKLIEMVGNLTELNIRFRYVNKITREVKVVRANAIPTRLNNGNTIMNGIIIDITEIENNYKQLEEANTRYEYLSKATCETVWEKNIDTNEIILGGGYKEMFGCEFPNDIITFEDWKKFVHPDDLKRTLAYIELRTLITEKRYCEFAYRFIRKDGTILDVFERAYIVYDEKDTKVINVVGTTQDITPLRIAQAEKDKMIDDLLERNKNLEQFTYMVSHNFRAPIANILGITSVLEDKTLDENIKEVMNENIKKSVKRLNEVIIDMNAVLSIKKNTDEVKTEIILQNVVNEIMETEIISEERAKVDVITDFSLAPSVISIKSYIHSIFQNLISNAIKYKGEINPFLKIISSEDAEYLYLMFEDNGIGIDMVKNADKVFRLYSRFHLEKEGKGMGLFMVKSQVENLNGEIEIQSKINEGTRFLIKLKKLNDSAKEISTFN